MGCGPSKSDLSVVQEVTGMTKKDAKESFDGFKKQAGGSKIKLDKFTKLVSSLNTNTGTVVLVKVTDMPNIGYIFEKVMGRGLQKQCSRMSHLQIHKYKYTNTNTQIQLRSKCYFFEKIMV